MVSVRVTFGALGVTAFVPSRNVPYVKAWPL
jgi:hypothetical protein